MAGRPRDRRDEDIREIARIAAGHFDHYICRRDDNTRGRDGDEVPTLQHNELLTQGIDASAIEMIPDEQQATVKALEMAQPGDLLLILGDSIARSWKQIIYFNAGANTPADSPHSAAQNPLPVNEDFSIDESMEIIRDERGVRIAREEGD